MLRTTLTGLLAALGLAVAASPASASTFAGSCKMSGTIIPLKPYKFIPENNDAEMTGSGTCSGVLDGRQYDGPVHLYIDGRMDSPMSCGLLAAQSVPGSLTFAPDARSVDATVIDLKFPQAFEVLGHMLGRANGAYNGEGLMKVVLKTSEADLRACAGTGLGRVDFDLELFSLTTLYG